MNVNGSGIDPQFTMRDTSPWTVRAQEAFTFEDEGDHNTVNILSYATGWNAATYCNNLVKDGYDNWYLPSAAEWETLLMPIRSVLMLDGSSPDYWSSTFGFTGWNDDPHFFKYEGNIVTTGYYESGNNSIYTRCLRKHGEAMPSAAAPDPFVHRYNSDMYWGLFGQIYAPFFRPLYTTNLNTQTVGTAAIVEGINFMVPVTISGPGTPDFRWRAPAGVWSGYVTSATVGPGYEIQPRAFTPLAAGQEFAINIKVGANNQVWKVRTIQAATRRIFVTSATYNGNMGGLSGADANCQSQAAGAGLTGTWYALLGGNYVNGFSRIPWNWNRLETMNAALVANNMGELEDTGNNLSAINRNQANVSTTTTNVWTGMTRMHSSNDPYYSQDGSTYDAWQSCAPTNTVREWTTSSSSRSGRVGQINNIANWIDNENPVTCNQTRRLYCVGPF